MSPDAPATTAYLWSRTKLISEIKQVLDSARRWPAVVIQPDRDGLRLLVGGTAFGHLRWDGRLDVAVPENLRDRLVAEEMAACDPDESRSDRVVWIVRTHADVDRALWLLRLAYLRSSIRA